MWVPDRSWWIGSRTCPKDFGFRPTHCCCCWRRRSKRGVGGNILTIRNKSPDGFSSSSRGHTGNAIIYYTSGTVFPRLERVLCDVKEWIWKPSSFPFITPVFIPIPVLLSAFDDFWIRQFYFLTWGGPISQIPYEGSKCDYIW